MTQTKYICDLCGQEEESDRRFRKIKFMEFDLAHDACESCVNDYNIKMLEFSREFLKCRKTDKTPNNPSLR